MKQASDAKAKSGSKALLAPLAGLAAGLALLILAGGLFVSAQIFGPGPPTMSEITFSRGMSVSSMGRELEVQHVIHSAALFRLLARFRGHASEIKAGTYDFPANASLIDVLKQMEEGRVLQTYVTVPEGVTSAQVVRRLMKMSDLTGDIDVPPEGSILPETYLYQKGETRQAVLDRMLDAGRKTLNDLWGKRVPGLPFASKEEALIMASIVERETGVASERPRVAAVFINRLKEGMRLGSDPTVIYGISHGESLGRGLRKSELETWTPWNTYLIDKLPMTPIANPGKAAIEAVLNPAPTRDLYFVADGSGGHAFAATYEEHLANVAKWRSMEAKVEVYSSSAVAPASEGSASAATVPVKTAQTPGRLRSKNRAQ